MGVDELIRQLCGPDWATPFTVRALLVPFLFGFVGIVANAAHRRWRGARIRSLRDYFTRDPGWTVAALTGYVIAFAVTAKLFYMNVVLGLMVGFLSDNVLNHYTGGGTPDA